MAHALTERQRSPESIRPEESAGFPILPIALALSLVAVLIRLHNLSHESLWYDEGYTLLFSRLPLDRLILVGGAHEHPPLYYLLVHAGLAVKNSYLVPRLISVVADSLSVLVLALLGARLFGRVAAVIAAGLLTISPFHLWYAQDGRAYALAGLLVLLSYLTLVMALDERRVWLWMVYAAVTALTLYTEYTTAPALVPQVIFLLRARRTGATRALVWSWVGVGAAYLPWIGTLALNLVKVAGGYWIQHPNPQTVAGTILEFLGFSTSCPTLPSCAPREAPLPYLAGHEIIVGAIFGLIALAVLYRATRDRDLPVAVVATWLVFPLGSIVAVSAARPLFVDRIFLDSTFPLYLLLGYGAARALRGAWLQWLTVGAAVLVAGASLFDIGVTYSQVTNPDWKSPMRDFVAAYRPGEPILYYPSIVKPLATAYLPGDWRYQRGRGIWRIEYFDVPGWRVPPPAVTNTDAVMRQLATDSRGANRLWVLSEDYTGLPIVRLWLAEHGYHLDLSQMYDGDTRLDLWDRMPSSRFGPRVVSDDRFSAGWLRKRVTVRGAAACTSESGSLTRTFPVQPETAYTINIQHRSGPSVRTATVLRVFDRSGALLTTFPRFKWYEWPGNDVWLIQPFGFITPPGAASATLSLRGGCWRHVAVFRRR